MHKTKYFYFIQAYFSLLLLLRLFFVTTFYFFPQMTSLCKCLFAPWIIPLKKILSFVNYLPFYAFLNIFFVQAFSQIFFRKKVFNLNVPFVFYIDKNFFWKFVFAWKCHYWYFTWPGFTQYNSFWIYVVINILSKRIEQKSCRFTKPFQQ